jgi:CBS domain containing-hemolysin-like protein
VTSPDSIPAPQWQAIDLALAALLPVLVALSAFFSACETTLFGLRPAERMSLRRSHSLVARAVDALLADPRSLLITVLLGNMTVNVVYFVISSVLLMKSDVGLVGEVLLALASLVVLTCSGVLPKVIANVRRTRAAVLLAPPLLVLHRLITPLRLVIDRMIVSPLSRLTAPTKPPPALAPSELASLLEISGREGVIDAEEQRILLDVLKLGRLKVRDVMTPRVRMIALPAEAGRDEVAAAARTGGLAHLPVYQDDLDHIIGMLPLRRFLLEAGPTITARSLARPVGFVPEIATLEQLLNHFRTSQSQLVIVVDEYGGTSGIVALQDVVEQLVGELASGDDAQSQRPVMIGPGRWRVGGDVSVHDWAEAFGATGLAPRVATLGGLITNILGRGPEVGDSVDVGSVRLEVEQVDGARVATAIITLLDEEPDAPAGESHGEEARS